MIYAALEHLIRRDLTAKNIFFPDKKKPTQKLTAKWVCCCFIEKHHFSADSEVKGILNINTRQEIIFKLFE